MSPARRPQPSWRGALTLSLLAARLSAGSQAIEFDDEDSPLTVSDYDMLTGARPQPHASPGRTERATQPWQRHAPRQLPA
jgi:hypothetical protein